MSVSCEIRKLAELILTRDIHSIFPPDIVPQLQELGEKIASGQKQIQTGTAENPTVLAQELLQLRQKRNNLQDSVLAIGSSFKFEQLQRTLDEHTAIIQWYVLGDKFLALIITSDPPLTPPYQAGLFHSIRWNSLSRELDRNLCAFVMES